MLELGTWYLVLDTCNCTCTWYWYQYLYLYVYLYLVLGTCTSTWYLYLHLYLVLGTCTCTCTSTGTCTRTCIPLAKIFRFSKDVYEQWLLPGNPFLRMIIESLWNIGKFLGMPTGSHAHEHIFCDSGHPKVQHIDFVWLCAQCVESRVHSMYAYSRMLNKLILCLCLVQYTLSPWSGSPDPKSHDRVTSHDGQVRLTCTVQMSCTHCMPHFRIQT